MTRILFVCYGNICRSPMAEYLFKDMINKRGLSDKFYIESAGISNEEETNPVHYKVKKILDHLNIDSSNKRARQIRNSDYDNFDYIIGMENSNVISIKRILDDYDNKVFKLLDFTLDIATFSLFSSLSTLTTLFTPSMLAKHIVE